VIIGGAFALHGARRRQRNAVAPAQLSEAEQRRVEEILKQE
jgi:cytochrome c-type biogenesis protein CcmH/NrfF